MRSGVGDQRSKATGRGLLEASWNPGAKLARLTFRLQGQGRGAVLYSSFHELDWRG
jgi:hypothetical protein